MPKGQGYGAPGKKGKGGGKKGGHMMKDMPKGMSSSKGGMRPH